MCNLPSKMTNQWRKPNPTSICECNECMLRRQGLQDQEGTHTSRDHWGPQLLWNHLLSLECLQNWYNHNPVSVLLKHLYTITVKYQWHVLFHCSMKCQFPSYYGRQALVSNGHVSSFHGSLTSHSHVGCRPLFNSRYLHNHTHSKSLQCTHIVHWSHVKPNRY